MPPEGRISSLGDWLDKQAKKAAEGVRKTLYGAVISIGGLLVKDGGRVTVQTVDGVEVVKIGEHTASGTGTVYQAIIFRRPDGTKIFATFPVDTDPNVIAWALYDQQDRIIMSSDAATGGLALPWLAVPMYPRFTVAASSTYDYMTIDAAELATEKTLWEGRINKLLGPRLQVNGVWGQASGSNSTTYRLMVSGTEVGTWTQGALQAAIKGPFDVSDLFGATEATVQLRATATGTGAVAVQLLGLTQRQT